jgi:hypothetical protein
MLLRKPITEQGGLRRRDTQSPASCKQISSASLQRQPDTEGAVDGTNRLALPFQHGRIPPEDVAKTGIAVAVHSISGAARIAKID